MLDIAEKLGLTPEAISCHLTVILTNYPVLFVSDISVLKTDPSLFNNKREVNMEWQKKYEVGHDKIDLEHRVFLDLVRTVAEAEAEGASRDKIRRLVAETAKYAEFHFLSEENIMIDFGYPDFEEHQKIHKDLIKSLQHFVISFEAGDNNIGDLVEFLVSWFSVHTTTEDLKISKYLDQT